MDNDRSGHDIKEGTLFCFKPNQRLLLHVDADEQLNYVYKASAWCPKGTFDTKVIPYMGLKRVAEILLPRSRSSRRRRAGVFVLKPAFIMGGVLVFVESFDLLQPFEGQVNVFKDNDNEEYS